MSREEMMNKRKRCAVKVMNDTKFFRKEELEEVREVIISYTKLTNKKGIITDAESESLIEYIKSL